MLNIYLLLRTWLTARIWLWCYVNPFSICGMLVFMWLSCTLRSGESRTLYVLLNDVCSTLSPTNRQKYWWGGQRARSNHINLATPICQSHFLPGTKQLPEVSSSHTLSGPRHLLPLNLLDSGTWRNTKPLTYFRHPRGGIPVHHIFKLLTCWQKRWLTPQTVSSWGGGTTHCTRWPTRSSYTAHNVRTCPATRKRRQTVRQSG